MRLRYRVGADISTALIRRRVREALLIECDDVPLRVSWQTRDAHHGRIECGTHSSALAFAVDGDTIYVHWRGRTYDVAIVHDGAEHADGLASERSIRAPMPGTVLEVFIAPGEQVSSGQRVILIESMKLQSELSVAIDGTVRELKFAPGETFEKGAILVELD